VRPQSHDERNRDDVLKDFWNGVKSGLHETAQQELEQEDQGNPDNLGKINIFTAAFLRRKAQKAALRVRQNLGTSASFIIDPLAPRKVAWDNTILVMALYSIVVSPFRLAFHASSAGSTLFIAVLIDLAFLVDLFLGFITGYRVEQGELVKIPHAVIDRYLRRWFVVDFIAAIPWMSALRPLVGTSPLILAQMVKGLRLVPLLQTVSVNIGKYEINPVAFSITKVSITSSHRSGEGACIYPLCPFPSSSQTLAIVILAAHLLSCLWFYVSCFASVYGPLDERQEDWQECGYLDDRYSQYLASFYFIIYTMMTVGYGDISAREDQERILAIFIELVGATLFGFIIAATRRMVQFIHPIDKASVRNTSEISVSIFGSLHWLLLLFLTLPHLQDYITDRRLSDGLASKVRRHFRYYYFKTSVFKERAVQQGLPLQLKWDLMVEIHGSVMGSLGLMDGGKFSHKVMMQLMSALKPAELQYLDTICTQGGAAMEMYFVVKGRVEAYHQETGGACCIAGDNLGTFIGVWGPGSRFCLHNVVTSTVCELEATYVSASRTDVLWLEQGELHRIMEGCPNAKAYFEELATDAAAGLRHVLSTETLRQDGFVLKEEIVTDFTMMKVKQHLKHTDPGSLAQVAAATVGKRRTTIGSPGVLPRISRIRRAVGLGPKGSRKASDQAPQRLVRTWRTGDEGAMNQAVDANGRILPGIMETEETVDEVTKRFLLMPDELYKLRWDLLLILLASFEAVLVPFQLAFEAGVGMSGLSLAIDIFFIADVVFTFRCPYWALTRSSALTLVTVPSMIAVRYLKRTFLIDVLSSITLFLPDNVGFRSLRLLRTLRIRFLSVTLRQLAESTTNRAKGRSLFSHYLSIVPRSVWEFMNVCLTIYFCAHIFGCLWWLTTRAQEIGSWWNADGIDGNDKATAYLASVYWALTTTTTVGYGDIRPVNDTERLVACITMICGTTMFSYIIGTVNRLARNPSGGGVRRTIKLQSINDYLEEGRVAGRLRDSIRAHMRHVIWWRSAYDEDEFLRCMPSNLRNQVLLQVHGEIIEKIPILQKCTLCAQAMVAWHLRPHVYMPGEDIYESNRLSQGLYFVMKGIAEAFTASSGSEDRVLAIIPAGKFFGYSWQILGSTTDMDVAVRAFTGVHIMLLSNSSIRTLSLHYPLVARALGLALESAIYDQAKLEIEQQQATTRAAGGNRAKFQEGIASQLSRRLSSDNSASFADMTIQVPLIEDGVNGGVRGSRTLSAEIRSADKHSTLIMRQLDVVIEPESPSDDEDLLS
jgi:CRP-like cAMP-binding protein